jgi:rhodanese-related sulfurtransferase
MFKFTKIIVLAFSLIATTVFAQESPLISQKALLESLSLKKDIVLLDVRSEEEYNHGHIAGAINISHDMIKDNLSKMAQFKDSKVVVYCRSGRRAGIAEKALTENGFKHIYHLTGDMNGWIEAKLPVVSNKHKH